MQYTSNIIWPHHMWNQQNMIKRGVLYDNLYGNTVGSAKTPCLQCTSPLACHDQGRLLCWQGQSRRNAKKKEHIYIYIYIKQRNRCFDDLGNLYMIVSICRCLILVCSIFAKENVSATTITSKHLLLLHQVHHLQQPAWVKVCPWGIPEESWFSPGNSIRDPWNWMMKSREPLNSEVFCDLQPGEKKVTNWITWHLVCFLFSGFSFGSSVAGDAFRESHGKASWIQFNIWMFPKIGGFYPQKWMVYFMVPNPY